MSRVWVLAIVSCVACSGEEFSSQGAGGAAGGGGGGAGAGGGGGVSGAVSCKALLKDGVTASGVYTLAPANGVPFAARCDMETDGGGWTLVARSADGTLLGNGFGWKKAAGAPEDASSPYSLDLAVNRVPYSEMLLAERDSAYGVVKGFSGSLPNAFLKDYSTAPLELVPPVSWVVGPCQPPSAPWMMTHVGFTDQSDVYFVRDNPVNEPFGLRADGWALGENMECQYNAEYNGHHGMILVR